MGPNERRRMNETSVIQVEVYAEDADEAFGVIEGALAGAGILATVIW